MANLLLVSGQKHRWSDVSDVSMLIWSSNTSKAIPSAHCYLIAIKKRPRTKNEVGHIRSLFLYFIGDFMAREASLIFIVSPVGCDLIAWHRHFISL